MIAQAIQRAARVYLAFLLKLVERTARRPLAVLAIALVLSAISVVYIAQHFSIDTDTSALLSRDLPFQKNQFAINEAFPQLRDTIVAVVDGTTPGQADQAASRLAQWAEHHDQDYQFVYRPGGGSFFAANGLLYLSPNQLDALGDRLATAQPLIATLANDPSVAQLFDLLAQALTSPDQAPPDALSKLLDQIDTTVTASNAGRYHVLNWQRVISASGGSPLDSSRRFVIIKPQFDYSELQPAAPPIAHLRHAIDQLGLTGPGARVRLTGSAVLDNEQLSAVSQGAGWATGLALALVVILLAAALRSVRRVAAALLTLTFGLIWTTAVGLFAVGQFNILSIAFAVLFIGLSVDFGIQFCMRSREVATRGLNHMRILPATAHEIGGAITLAGLAAAASFFSVVPTAYSGLSDLGIIAGIGMLIAVAANLSVLPVLLRLFGADRPVEPTTGARKTSVYAPIVRRGRLIVTVATLAGIVSIPLALQIDFDFNPLSLENPDSEAMQTLDDLMHSEDFSPYTINILEPNLGAARKLAAKLEKRPTIDSAVTLASYVPEHQSPKLSRIADLALVLSPSTLQINQLAKPKPDATQRAIKHLRQALQDASGNATNQHLADQLAQWAHHHGHDRGAIAKLQKRTLGTLPHQLQSLKKSLNAQKISLDDLPHSLTSRYLTNDGRARVEVFSKLDLSKNVNLERFVSDVHGLAPGAAGTPVLLVEGGHAVIRAFIQASITAFIAIALLLWLVLHRWRDVALALSPLPLAGLLTTATMVALGLSFNLANMIVLPLLIGLGVAYGIYFVVRWQTQVSLADTMRSSTPSAVLFSALTTACSFGSLALAPSRGMAVLGETLSIALGYILISTLLVLPALLSLLPPTARNAEGEESGS